MSNIALLSLLLDHTKWDKIKLLLDVFKNQITASYNKNNVVEVSRNEVQTVV